MGSLGERQFALLARMAALRPPPCFIGGYAEDALLAGTVTRPHGDIDWILARSQLDLRLRQAQGLGFGDFETWGEAAPGEPFYLMGQNGDLRLELGIADEADGQLLMKVYRLAFEVGGREAPAGYVLQLPDDLFDHPPVELDGVTIHSASPLGLYQIRVGIASQGSFGELSDTQRESARRLRERFFANHSDDELAPRIERLRA